MADRPQKYEVRSMEQMKALSNKLRVAILNVLGDQVPRTNKQIARELGMAPTKIHYHIRELEKVGLLEVVETRHIGGIVEKYYLPVAVNIYIVAENKSEVKKALVAEYIDAFYKGEGGGDSTEYINTLHFTPEEKEQFDAELKKLYRKWESKCASKTGPDGETWRFLCLVYPNRTSRGTR